MVSNINIKDSYNLEFEFEDDKYNIKLYDFIDFIRNYYCDDIVENNDGICDIIDYYADSYDLISIIRIVEELNEYCVANNEYIVLDATYYYSNYFNNFSDIEDVYDIPDILENICNDIDHLNYYCDKV